MDPATKSFFQDQKQNGDNALCIDCATPHPQWASVNLGCYFCLLCSGQHRSLGVHISFVRSITMDTWSDSQKAYMEKGGNTRLKQFMQTNGIATMKLTEKYNTKAAEFYRQQLRFEVTGEGSAPAPIDPSEAQQPAFVAPTTAQENKGPAFLSNTNVPPAQQEPDLNEMVGAAATTAAAGFWSAWGAASTLASKAKEATAKKLEEAQTEGYVPDNTQEWFANIGDKMRTGLEKAAEKTKEISEKAYTTVTDENFVDNAKTFTLEAAGKAYEKTNEVTASVSMQFDRSIRQSFTAEGRSSNEFGMPAGDLEQNGMNRNGMNGAVNQAAAPTVSGGFGSLSDDIDLAPNTAAAPAPAAPSGSDNIDAFFSGPAAVSAAGAASTAAAPKNDFDVDAIFGDASKSASVMNGTGTAPAVKLSDDRDIFATEKKNDDWLKDF